MWFYCRNRTGGVVFYAMRRCVPALQQLCRVTIRKQVISTKVDHLHLPVRLKEFLKYHDLWFTRDFPKTLISLTLYLMIHVYKPKMDFSWMHFVLESVWNPFYFEREFCLFTFCYCLFLNGKSFFSYVMVFLLAYVFIIWKI